jgi:hypothetical protein
MEPALTKFRTLPHHLHHRPRTLSDLPAYASSNTQRARHPPARVYIRFCRICITRRYSFLFQSPFHIILPLSRYKYDSMGVKRFPDFPVSAARQCVKKSLPLFFFSTITPIAPCIYSPPEELGANSKRLGRWPTFVYIDFFC